MWGAGRSERARDGRDCALPAVIARGADVPGRWFAADCARPRSILHAALLGLYCMMSVGGVRVKTPVPGRSFSVLTPLCQD